MFLLLPLQLQLHISITIKIVLRNYTNSTFQFLLHLLQSLQSYCKFSYSLLVWIMARQGEFGTGRKPSKQYENGRCQQQPQANFQ